MWNLLHFLKSWQQIQLLWKHHAGQLFPGKKQKLKPKPKRVYGQESVRAMPVCHLWPSGSSRCSIAWPSKPLTIRPYCPPAARSPISFSCQPPSPLALSDFLGPLWTCPTLSGLPTLWSCCLLLLKCYSLSPLMTEFNLSFKHRSNTEVSEKCFWIY